MVFVQRKTFIQFELSTTKNVEVTKTIPRLFDTWYIHSDISTIQSRGLKAKRRSKEKLDLLRQRIVSVLSYCIQIHQAYK